MPYKIELFLLYYIEKYTTANRPKYMNYFLNKMPSLTKGQKCRYMECTSYFTKMDMDHGIYIGDTPCKTYCILVGESKRELSIEIKYIKPEMVVSCVDDIRMNLFEVDILYKYVINTMKTIENEKIFSEELIPRLYLDFFAYSRYKTKIPKFVGKPMPMYM